MDSLVFLKIEVAPSRDWLVDDDSWSLLGSRKGHGMLYARAWQRAIETGEAVLLPPGLQARLSANGNGGLAAACFKFRPERLGGLLNLSDRLLLRRGHGQPNAILFFPERSSLARTMGAMCDQLGPPGCLEHRCQLLQFLAPILAAARESLGRLGNGSSDAHHHFNAMFGRLSEDDLVGLHVDALARKCGCSRRHLNRLVHQHLGCSLIHLKLQLRLDKAAALLENPDAKVLTVALECGFGHLGLFSARFKERFGATPGQWRDQQLAAASTASPEPGAGSRAEPRRQPDGRAPRSLRRKAGPRVPTTGGSEQKATKRTK